MTKKEKFVAIMKARAEGFLIRVKQASGVDVRAKFFDFDGDKIMAIVDTGAGTVELDISNLNVSKYYSELICGATTEEKETAQLPQ